MMRLPGVPPFDVIGDVASLALRWKKDQFILFGAASGVTENSQKRVLLLHLGGPGYKNSFPLLSLLRILAMIMTMTQQSPN